MTKEEAINTDWKWSNQWQCATAECIHV